MAAFKVTYPSGLVEVTQASDCETVEQFANTKFGSVNYAEAGTKVKKLTDKQYESHLRSVAANEPDEPDESDTAATLADLATQMSQEAANAQTGEERAAMEKAAAEVQAQAQAAKAVG